MTGTQTARRNGTFGRAIFALALVCATGFSQDIVTRPVSTTAGQESQRPNISAPASATARTRADALRLSLEHFKVGRSWLEAGRFLDARVEFDTAVETLVGESSIDFTSDVEARAALEKLIQDIHRLEVSRMDLADPSATPVYQQSPLDQVPELTFPIDPSLKATVVDQIRSRTGEFPLEVNDIVLSYVRYFTSERGSRTFVAGYRRSGRYRDMILRILDEEGLPRELLHLAQAESGFLPRAVSWAAAGGLWQFIPSRGQEYGLMQSSLTDDRFDAEKATRAAARHLRDLYHQFGDWNLAMAAYNCGPACVDRGVERTGFADFWELRRLSVIPKETTNYVPIVQALAIISLNPSAYGIELPEMDPAQSFDTHTLEAKTNLNLVADLIGVTKAEIRDLNPAVKGDLAPAGYTLRVPKQSVPTLLSGLSQVPEGNRIAWRAHRVSDGETLPVIAKQYKTTSSQIAKVNSLVTDAGTPDAAQMQAGDLLLIPATYSVPAAKRKAPTSSRKKATSRKVSSKKSTTKKVSTRKTTSSSRKKTTAAKKASSKSSKSGTSASAKKKTSPTKSASVRRISAGNSAK